MVIGKDHELHERRRKNNAMLGYVLGGFVLLVFAVTVAKMMRGHNMEAFDHVRRPALEQTQ